MKAPSQSPIIAVACRLIAPLIQIVALYVLFHGHYSPGGGFQGGVLLAASFILIRMALGLDAGQFQFPTRAGVVLGGIGVLFYAGVGAVSLLAGGNYLDYGSLPLPGFEPGPARSLGILLVEVGVMLAVSAVITVIYDDLIGSAGDA
ncbi:MAG: MnhB domain-containing protein [Deferrisomatales bacterium]|nr:MnhB domain-containing protein [Deferrisomatales bacterium]